VSAGICPGGTRSSEQRPAPVALKAPNREHGLAEGLLLYWRKEHTTRGEAAFGPSQTGEREALAQKVAELERFCGQLALGNAALKWMGFPSRCSSPLSKT